MAAVTINLSDVQRVITSDWIDTLGTEHTGEPVPPGYGSPTWTADDGGALIDLAPSNIPPQCTLNMKGATGTFVLTETATKAGSPNMVGTLTVTIAGPIPSHLNPLLQPLS